MFYWCDYSFSKHLKGHWDQHLSHFWNIGGPCWHCNCTDFTYWLYWLYSLKIWKKYPSLISNNLKAGDAGASQKRHPNCGDILKSGISIWIKIVIFIRITIQSSIKIIITCRRGCCMLPWTPVLLPRALKHLLEVGLVICEAMFSMSKIKNYWGTCSK